MEGLGVYAGVSTAVVATDCVDSSAERGSLNVELVGEEDVLGALNSGSITRSAARRMVMVVEREVER